MEQLIHRLRSSPINRRDAMRLIGAASLAAAGLDAWVEHAGATTTPALRQALARFQSGTPESTPMPMVVPPLGKQADGTTRWHVIVGAMDMTNNIEIQAFLPGEITINEGDSIWFDIGQMPGFHTITFLGGQDVPPLFVPDATATPVAGGPPPNMLINPAVVFPVGGPAIDGSAYVNSGVVVFADPTQPIIYTFPKAGSYDYLCLPHQSVMKATITVQAKGTAYPMDQAAYDKKAVDDSASIAAAAKAEIDKYAQATSSAGANGATMWEATVGVGGTAQGRGQVLLPKELSIKAGDTVKWVHRAPGEPHTVTFVGSDTQPPEDTLVEPEQNGPPKIIQNNLTFLPQGGNTFSGKGLVNSGWLGIPPLNLPMEWSCTFDTPGEYIYYCALHGDAKGNGMAAKLTVTAK